jgi:anti-anti-sigma factor
VDNDALSAAAKPLVLPEFVTPPGEIDITNAHSIGDELYAAIGRGVTVVIADMTRTTFLDSCGVRYLVLASKHAAQASTQLRLVIKSAAVLRILQITGADQLLRIYPNPLAALEDPLAEAQEAPGEAGG